jgi:hypothetical protein
VFRPFPPASERQASQQDRDERFGVDLEAAGTEREVDAARVPEDGVCLYVPVVGRVDEYSEGHPPAVLVKVIAGHLPDLQPAVKDRRCDVQ